MDNVITELYNVIKSRKDNKQEGSYTAYLFQQGIDKILKKCGEECSEMIIAAKNQDGDELVNEVCDLIYHVLVLLNNQDIEIERIFEELQKRSLKTGNLKPSKTVDKNS